MTLHSVAELKIDDEFAGNDNAALVCAALDIVAAAMRPSKC